MRQFDKHPIKLYAFWPRILCGGQSQKFANLRILMLFFVAASNQLQKEKKMRFFELKMTLVIVINYLIIHFRVKETKYVRKNEQKREITKVQRKDDSKTKRNRIELSSWNAFVPWKDGWDWGNPFQILKICKF